MKFSISDKTFPFVGVKHIERFEDYPNVIPKAVKEFDEKFPIEKNMVRAIFYEPKKGPDHEVGFFYVGALVNDSKQEIPEEMSILHLEGKYASVRDTFDVTKMGVFYDSLDRWVVENNLERKDVFDELMIELYYPTEDGIEDLEIFMRII